MAQRVGAVWVLAGHLCRPATLRPIRFLSVSVEAPPIQFLTPSTPAEWDATRLIFREYARSLGVDLCFQNFEAELDGLPGDYAEPRGALLLALVNGQIAGCCAMRPLDNVDYPNASEMKRLYVRKAFRGSGLGRQLAEAILDAARRAGYSCVLLDTLDDMEAARALYEDLGFEDIPPYYHSPIVGAHYLKAGL
ncbi:MAG: GNAT family N-acetyltransferase [Comamonadaceae bacterium]|nr:GNAT family N-acetyltransferase [Comamonadaceae bacterium]